MILQPCRQLTPRVLVLSDVLFDSRCELRRMALHHLLDARLKLVEKIDPRVAANRRTEIVEWRRRGADPIWTVGSVDSD